MPERKSGRKYSAGASRKVENTMHERKEGTLRSGSGKKVTSRKQAIAIGLSEARKAGERVPKERAGASSSRRRRTAKKVEEVRARTTLPSHANAAM